jgi:acyl carrier protein
MSDAIVHRLIQLAAKRFGGDASALRPEHDIFDALGIDSFQAAELTSDLELEFDVEIPDYELQGVRTFAALAATIQKRL